MSMTLGLPMVWQIALYAIAALIGVGGFVFGSKWVSKWINQLIQAKRDQEITSARDLADQSQTDLNDQTDKLPKD